MAILQFTTVTGAADAPPNTTSNHVITVINRGKPGRNTPEAAAALDRDVLKIQPHHVILFFGMNDALNSAKLIPLPDYEKAMRGMVKRLSDSGVKTVVLVTLHPIIEPYVQARHPKHPRRDDLQGHLLEYDLAVRALASEKQLPLVDLRKLIEDNGGATITNTCLIRCEANGGGMDGLHLTAAAYEKLGALTFDALKEQAQPGDTVVCYGDSLTYGSGVKGQGTTAGEPYPAVLQRRFDETAGKGNPTGSAPPSPAAE